MQQNYRGRYDSTQSYSQYDIVAYQDAITGKTNYYLCLTANNSQSPQPPVSGNDSEYWGIINSLSDFPNSIDSFINHTNITASDQSDISTYEELFLKTNRTPTEDDQLNSLTQKLRSKLILPEDINFLQESIMNLQSFFKDNVEGYISQRQSEFDAKVDKFVDRGKYDPTIQYYEKNIVYYNGYIYIAKADNLNSFPIGNDSDSYWRLLSKPGKQGDPGVTVTYKGDYDAGITYSQNDSVTYGDVVYYAKKTTTGNPPNDKIYWQIFDRVYINSTAPNNTEIVWLDTNEKIFKTYNSSTSAWEGMNSTSSTQISDGTNTYKPLDIKTIKDTVDNHVADKSNPHFVTASQVGAYSKSESDARYETPDGAQSKVNIATGKSLNIYKSGKDTNGIFTTIEWKRSDGTLAKESVLSSPDTKGNYQTQTINYYDIDGTTILTTETYTISYDVEGDVVSEVI